MNQQMYLTYEHKNNFVVEIAIYTLLVGQEQKLGVSIRVSRLPSLNEAAIIVKSDNQLSYLKNQYVSWVIPVIIKQIINENLRNHVHNYRKKIAHLISKCRTKQFQERKK